MVLNKVLCAGNTNKTVFPKRNLLRTDMFGFHIQIKCVKKSVSSTSLIQLSEHFNSTPLESKPATTSMKILFVFHIPPLQEKVFFKFYLN